LVVVLLDLTQQATVLRRVVAHRWQVALVLLAICSLLPALAVRFLS
jgi:hypothetical protein